MITKFGKFFQILCQFLHGCFVKAEPTASIHHIWKFLKSGIPIYNSKVPETADRKTRRITEAIAKSCVSRKRKNRLELRHYV